MWRCCGLVYVGPCAVFNLQTGGEAGEAFWLAAVALQVGVIYDGLYTRGWSWSSGGGL